MRVCMWTMRRAFQDRGTWALCVLLAICSLILSGGVSMRTTLHEDIMLVNVAYGTDFATMEEFRTWFDLWQFRWLMGAFGQMCLFPIAAWMLPQKRSPEIRIPVSMGFGRTRVWLAALLRYCGQICMLSVLCVLFGAVISGIRPAQGASAGYYLRCLMWHIWRDLGYAGVALIFVLLPAKRATGMCLSFGIMLGLAVLSTSGILTGTWLHVLFARMSQQEKLWLWQIAVKPPVTEVVLVVLFPLVTFSVASVVGLVCYRADLR